MVVLKRPIEGLQFKYYSRSVCSTSTELSIVIWNPKQVLREVLRQYLELNICGL